MLRILVSRNQNEDPVILGCTGSEADCAFVQDSGIGALGPKYPEYGLWVWEGRGEHTPDDYLLFGAYRRALASDLPQFVQSSRKELIPHQLVHPGQILARELKARGLSLEAFLSKSTVSLFPSYWERLVGGEDSIDVSAALQIEKALGISASFWLSAQLQYARWILAKQADQTEGPAQRI